MNKGIKYSIIAILGLVVVFAFVTAKNYTQLGLAIALYPFIVYIMFKLAPDENSKKEPAGAYVTIRPVEPLSSLPQGKVEITDIDKRTFLKLVGAAGLSFFIFSILGKRIESLLLGNAIKSKIPGLQGLAATQTEPIQPSASSVNQDYKISEIDDLGDATYYGFVNKAGNWMVMKEDASSSTFRYSKGDKDFEKNWASRENLKYDYFHNLF